MKMSLRIWSPRSCWSQIRRAMSFSSNRSTKNPRPYTIVVEGNIGSGKTTFLQPFTKHPDQIEVMPEPVSRWRNLQGQNQTHNLLQKFYEDPTRYSLLLQTYIQLTMVQTQTQPCTKPIRMMERSLLSARYCFVENLYNSGKMEEAEYLVLSEWCNYLMTAPQLNFHVDLIIYLKTDPEIAYERILNRDRQEENRIPLQYLKDLHELHEDWLVRGNKFTPKAPVKVIDANGDLNQLKPKFHALEEYILERHAFNI
jgi:deoxyadenosine/deoxycytidine kinase